MGVDQLCFHISTVADLGIYRANRALHLHTPTYILIAIICLTTFVSFFQLMGAIARDTTDRVTYCLTADI